MEETPSEETSNKDGNQLTTFSSDNLVEVHSKKLYKGPSKLSICFAILAILLFIIMVIFIILYSKNEPKICTSEECVRTASYYRASMNDSVDPCDNFYEFVCGRWSDLEPVHLFKGSFSVTSKLKEKITIDSVNILSKKIDIHNDPEAVKKSKHFYQSCLDIETLDKLGIAAIYPFLKKLNLPILPSFMNAGNKSDNNFNWMLTDTLAKQILQMDIFIGHSIDHNLFNGSQKVLNIGKHIRKSPLPGFYITSKFIEIYDNKDNDTAKELAKNANIDLITYLMNEIILNKTGKKADSDLLKEAADVIIEISDFIEETVTNTTDPNQQLEDTFAITVENLQNEINGYLKQNNNNFLATYLSHLFNNTNVTINTKSDLLYITKSDVNFLKRIMEYLAELPDINIELYMWWRTVYAMAYTTSSNIASFIFKKYNSFFKDSTISLIKIKQSVYCASLLLREDGFLQYAISYALANRSFGNDTKSKLENMIFEIKEAFLSSVKDLTWIDKKSKNEIFEKAKKIRTFIGYPNWLLEKGELDKYYKNIIIKPEAFLENMINIISSDEKQNMISLKEIQKGDEWHGNPAEVNANYIPNRNSIDIRMGIINFPYFNLGIEGLNYGALGTILGHEMIHGFDNNGRKFDKYGNLKPWWTNQTIKEFKNLTDCFVKQYERFTKPGVKEHVNGKKTLGENLADNGGLNQAFMAYRKYIGKYGEQQKLPGFENYNDYQMFFIVYANIWCETGEADDFKNQLLDAHCPNFIRVLGTLQNSEYFAHSFECPKGSPMNPMNKCRVW